MEQQMLQDIMAFLPCRTPDAWLAAACQQQETLLIDHAHCEKKAALTAIQFIHRYPQCEALLYRASRLAREELRHFEKVLQLLQQRHIPFTALSPSRYASRLHSVVRQQEPQRLVDLLIIAALIEARSCERFYALAPHLDKVLQTFYRSLFAAEARHFHLYLELAKQYSDQPLTQRIAFWAEQERQLIESVDQQFRFHSGVPVDDGP